MTRRQVDLFFAFFILFMAWMIWTFVYVVDRGSPVCGHEQPGRVTITCRDPHHKPMAYLPWNN